MGHALCQFVRSLFAVVLVMPSTNSHVERHLISFITARSSYASAVLGIIILSVCLSVTRVLCDENKEHSADILIPHERAITLVF